MGPLNEGWLGVPLIEGLFGMELNLTVQNLLGILLAIPGILALFMLAVIRVELAEILYRLTELLEFTVASHTEGDRESKEDGYESGRPLQ